ncbi:MAG: hypothetical protein V1834_02415 [Candidatus Micrarchaeota archaeon]
MKLVYLAMEFKPHAWNMPVGAYETREAALSECERLAKLQFQALKKRYKKRGPFNSKDLFIKKQNTWNGVGWSVLRKNRDKSGKTISTPLEINYHVTRLKLGASAVPLETLA